MIYLNSVVDSTHQEASEFIGFIQLPEILLNPCFEQVVPVVSEPGVGPTEMKNFSFFAFFQFFVYRDILPRFHYYLG